MTMNRREMMVAAGAAMLGTFPLRRAFGNAKAATKKVLFFTKSSGFEHSVIARKGDKLAHAERILTEIGKEHGFEVVPSKDGRLFDPDKIGEWDAFAFQTTGDLTKMGDHKDGHPMSKEGEKAFYDAIRDGKGFIGMHCATDTFGHHRHMDKHDPYIEMIGGEFAGHGSQQKAKIIINDPAFPGVKAFGTDSFMLTDEWYTQRNIADDLHVILTQETASMHHEGGDRMYNRPSFPETWAHMHGKGRVFYTSMGHREDVWSNPSYQSLLIGALDWVTGKVDASIEPNVAKVTPGYRQGPA